MQNSAFWTRIANLHGSQISPVVLCLQSNVIGTRTTCLYWSQPLSVVFACKRATFGPDLQVSKGTRSHLSFCACKTVCLASELLVSIGPSPHLRFLDANQRLLDQNCISQWVPDVTCDFLHAKPSIRITSVYGCQPSFVVFACKTAPFGPEEQISMGPRYHLSFCACKAT